MYEILWLNFNIKILRPWFLCKWISDYILFIHSFIHSISLNYLWPIRECRQSVLGYMFCSLILISQIVFFSKILMTPLLQRICFICFNESALKMMKNAFYFILKVLFVIKILKFLSLLFGHLEKLAWLER